MPVSKQQIPTLSDEALGLIATAADDTYPDEIVLAVWEELAARGLVVDFVEQSPLLRETQAHDLLTGDLSQLCARPTCPDSFVGKWHTGISL